MTLWTQSGTPTGAKMTVKGGRLEFLVPHLLRGQLLRPGFVRMSLRLGVAQQMPGWAKLQFTNAGVSAEDLDRVLGRVTSLASWVDEWERLARSHEMAGREAVGHQHESRAAEHFIAASAAYNFAQYVLFLDIERKRSLHQACVGAYAQAASLFNPPALPFDVVFRRRPMRGYLRIPPGRRPVPVAVLFNGTNAVKEEMHWWSEALLERGIATITFDGPGMGETFHRLSMVAEPRPVGVAILNQIEARPELDPHSVAFMGMSLGGYLALRMACHDPRIKAVAAISPPYSADVYWNITLVALRRELAALYAMDEKEMGKAIDKITLADLLAKLECPLMVAGGGHDHITPGSEAWRIFEDARCERELIFYPKGAHDCFNVLADLRPRMVSWIAHQLSKHHVSDGRGRLVSDGALDGAWMTAEAIHPEFADALLGEGRPLQWHQLPAAGMPVRWDWPWNRTTLPRIEVVHRQAGNGAGEPSRAYTTLA